MFSKEISIAIPAIISIYYLFNRTSSNIKVLTRLNIILVAGWILILFVWLLMRNNAIPGSIEAARLGVGPFIHNLATIPEFIAKFFLPVSLPAIPSFTFFFTYAGLILMATAIALVISEKNKNRVQIVFGMAWFLLFLLPSLIYRHQLGDAAFAYLNHRSYVPMMGILMLTVSLIPLGWQQRHMKLVLGAALCIAHILGIACFIQTKSYSDPMAFYTSAIRANPKSALAYNNRGKYQAATGEIQKGMADFNIALSLNPDYPDALSNRGYAKNRLKEYGSALIDLNKAIHIKPDFAAAFNNLGLAKYYLNDMQGAMECYGRAIELDSGYVDAYTNRAMLKMSDKDYVGAIEDYTKALAVDPQNAINYFNRGGAYFSIQDGDDACRDWQKAAALGDSEALQNVQAACRGAKRF